MHVLSSAVVCRDLHLAKKWIRGHRKSSRNRLLHFSRSRLSIVYSATRCLSHPIRYHFYKYIPIILAGGENEQTRTTTISAARLQLYNSRLLTTATSLAGPLFPFIQPVRRSPVADAITADEQQMQDNQTQHSQHFQHRQTHRHTPHSDNATLTHILAPQPTHAQHTH